MSEIDEYEEKVNEIKEENEVILERFAGWIKAKNLSKKQVSKHLSNVEFYINDFLTYYDFSEAKDGVSQVGFFLGDWFIRKAGWSNEKEIKSNALSLTTFYEFMEEAGEVTPDELKELKSEIYSRLSDWIEICNRYNDPTVDLDEVWEY